MERLIHLLSRVWDLENAVSHLKREVDTLVSLVMTTEELKAVQEKSLAATNKP